MKNLILTLFVAFGFIHPAISQCPPNAYAFASTYAQCPLGCGVLLKDWPEGVIVNVYGGDPLLIIASAVIPGTFGGTGIGSAFVCVPCNIPLVFASAIPGATNGCVIITLGVVPVKINNFSLSSNSDNSCQLKWSTENESGGTSYIVQRSSDARTFSDITTLAGKGNNSNNYIFTDRSAQPGTSFYRLKITDITNRITYSETALVKNQSGFGVSIYPNPVEGDFRVTIPGQFLPAAIEIFNTVGKPVYSTISRQTTVSITQTLPKGVYAVKVTGKNNVVASQKLLIK